MTYFRGGVTVDVEASIILLEQVSIEISKPPQSPVTDRRVFDMRLSAKADNEEDARAMLVRVLDKLQEGLEDMKRNFRT
jgi:hypothetical protein